MKRLLTIALAGTLLASAAMSPAYAWGRRSSRHHQTRHHHARTYTRARGMRHRR